MINKALRILIADEHPSQLMHVERMLNHMGYYRIAPVQSFETLLALVQSAVEPFDLLIANTEMAVRAGVDLPRLCKGSPQVHHALLYENESVPVPTLLPQQRESINVCLARLPDSEALQTLMDIVDITPELIEQPVAVITQRRHNRKRPAPEPALLRHS
ncbi:response regulator receiver protein [Pseudomonas sp. M47T1]|uniref:response regulator n=1 Tax=unclassified Pseudomonas TaxID=196821 RepID=UPI0002606C1F|nr:response regulator [Pseudomonas sp. M47T1]EIK94917.1 response regulator receiver protein [Pseudomonas sp. M47T1]